MQGTIVFTCCFEAIALVFDLAFVVPESLVDSSASNVIVTWLSISEC
jgi:hypothetical protein